MENCDGCGRSRGNTLSEKEHFLYRSRTVALALVLILLPLHVGFNGFDSDLAGGDLRLFIKAIGMMAYVVIGFSWLENVHPHLRYWDRFDQPVKENCRCAPPGSTVSTKHIDELRELFRDTDNDG